MEIKLENVQFSERFNQACERKGLSSLSQDELGRLLGVSGATIQYYRSGKRLPSMDTAIRICQLTKVSIDWLLLGKETQVSDIMEIWNCLSHEQKIKFLAMIAENGLKGAGA